MWLTVESKTVFVNIWPLLLVCPKKLFKQIHIFLRIFPFSNMLRKTNLLCISDFLSEIAIFWIKRDVLCEFSRKCFKTTEKHSLAVCGSFLAEKQFLLIFVHFYWFDKKKLFKQIQIFFAIYPFSNMLRKTNFLSFSVILSEIATFRNKKRISLWISPKMLQNNRKA